TGQPYTDYDIVYSNNKPISASYSNDMTATWTYNADGSLSEIVYNGITGQRWTTTDTLFGANGKPVSEVWTNGATTIQSETWNSDGTIHDIHYFGITGQAYRLRYPLFEQQADQRQLLQRHDRDLDLQRRRLAVGTRLQRHYRPEVDHDGYARWRKRQ